MTAVSAPPRVRARLRAAPDGAVPIVHRGPDAVYVALDDGVVGVVGTRAVAVPCALRTGLPRLPPVRRASVHAGVLHLDDVPLRIGRLVAVAVPRLRPMTTTAAPPPGDVPRMIGRGDGLTPYDDDVLCGWLAVHRAARVPTPDVDVAVSTNRHRTTLLSATLLDCARHGEAIPQFIAWLAAIGTDDADSATENRDADNPGAEIYRCAGRLTADQRTADLLAADLLAVGHSSGRGLLQGAQAALSRLRPVKEVA